MSNMKIENIKFDIVAVVYNRFIASIPWIETINENKHIANIIICDNSDEQTYSIENRKYRNIIYIDMHGNRGLSIAYNTAIKLCTSPHVVILDDDTELPHDYVNRVANSIQRYKDADIILPIVKSNKVLMSPCKKGLYRFSEVSNLNRMPRIVSAINSGMIIRTNLFRRIKYRESLFLDMIDHAFMDDARNLNASVVVDKTIVLRQNYSRETDSKSSAMRRYRITRSDERIYYSDSLLGRIYCELHLLYLKLRLQVKSHN